MRVSSEFRERFRIFYLEDDLDLSEDLRAILSDRLPGTVVDWADTIESGLHILDREQHYDIGLLDVRVPYRAHQQPEAHADVANVLRQRGIALLIYTGFVSSPDIEEYLTQKLTDPPLAVISKKVGFGLVDEIIKAIHDWFVEKASQQIRCSLEQTFEHAWESGFSFRGTGAILSLQQEIVDYWPYLNTQVRTLVAQRFHVREEHDAIVGLTLIPWSEPQ